MYFENKSTLSAIALREPSTMKRLTAAAAAILALTAAAGAQAGTIDLTLNGVQPKGGKILVTVQSRDQYMTFPLATAPGPPRPSSRPLP
jgi:uncharacterized protein (DUF2141 family)